jgi:hypothetical protein
VATDYLSSEPDQEIVVHVTKLDDPVDPPAAEVLDVTTLHRGGTRAQIAAYNDGQVWHGGANGAVFGWDGSSWSPGTPEPMTARGGELSFPGFSPSGRMFIPNVNGRPNKMLSHFNGEWSFQELPELAAPSAVYASSDTDAWALGLDDPPTAYHYDGSEWTPITLDMADPFMIFSMWGSSATDIWAAGGSEFSPVVLHYQGETWESVEEAAAQIRMMALYLDGSGPDDVYASSPFSTFIRFDGTSWAPVAHGLFPEADYLNVCLDDNTNETACGALTGTMFAGPMSVTDSGGVFAAIKETTYRWIAVSVDGRYGCSVGQFLCMPDVNDDWRGTTPVFFNGSDWVTQTLPEIPDSTEMGVWWFWAAANNRAYAVITYQNTVSTDYELKVITWDGTSWKLLPEQPELPPNIGLPALHGFQAGEIYLQLLPPEVDSYLYRYMSCEE